MIQKSGTKGINIYQFGEWTNQVEYIQNLIKIIVLTKKGGVPHDLKFGSGALDFLGSPSTSVPALLNDIYVNLIEYMPAWVEVVSVKPSNTTKLQDNNLNIDISLKDIESGELIKIGV
jgi:hypothetical protein